jgi:beta-glucosidase
VVSSREYLKDLLRYELDFHGMLVTDYGEINALHGEHATVATNREAVKLAMQDTSIDMSMTAWDVDFAKDLIDLVEKGEVPMARLDESVERIVQLKEDLGLLDHPYELVGTESPLDAKVGSMEDKRVALEAIRESITLLKNEHNLLPLDPKRKYNILVVGPTADSLTCQSGGWTMHWHGPLSDDEFSYGTTLFAAVKDMAAAGSTVDYLPGVDLNGTFVTDKEQLADRARHADLIIAGVGEGAYAEASGNILDLILPLGQEELVLWLAQASTAPIVTVLFEGRPRLLGSIPALSTAVLHGYLPGPDGGLGVGEILFGSVTPSGRIPFTYPKHQNGPTLVYYHKLRQRDYDVEWEFGAGLSYTSFAYEKPRITSGPTTDEYSPVEFSVKVRNTGKRAGKHTVMLFGADVVRRVTPEVKMLKAFNKTRELQPGETQTVTFTLDPMEDLSFYGVERHRVLEEGDWLFGLGEKVDCRKDASPCLKLTVKLSPAYSPICQAVCTAWGRVHFACAPVLLGDSSNNGTTTTKEMMEVVPQLGGSDHSSCMATCAQQGYWRWDMADCVRDVVMEPRTLCQQVKNICAYPF